MSVDPLLPYKLADEFGYREHEIGVFFFHFSAAVVIVTLLALFIPRNINQASVIVVGYIASTIGALLTGPSCLIGLPNSLGLVTAGMVVSGMAKSLL